MSSAGAILDEVCDPNDLRAAEAAHKMELAKNRVSANTQFQYAWCLVRSPSNAKLKDGVNLLEDLFRRASDDNAKRDYLFYMCVGYAKLKEYEKALKFADGILKVQPRNHQAKDLKEEITKRMKKDGVTGMAVAAVAAGAGVAVIGGLAAIIGIAATRR